MTWPHLGSSTDLPERESARLAAVRRFDVLEPDDLAVFDRLARLAAQLVDAPRAGVSLVDAEQIRFIGSHRLPVDALDRRHDCFCQQVVDRDDVLAIADAKASPFYEHQPLVAGDGLLPEGPVRLYVGAPVRVGADVVGSIWAISHEPRERLEDDLCAGLQDLAELASRELEAHVNQRHLRDLYQHAQDGVFTTSVTGEFVALNPAFETISGHPREAWLGRHFRELVHPDDVEVALEAFGRAVGGEDVRLELRLMDPDGEPRPVDVMAVPRTVGGTTHQVFGFARDIRERKEANRRLQEQASLLLERQEMIDKMARASSDALWDFDFRTGLVWWSPGFGDLFGYPDEVSQNTPDRWEDRIHPQDRKRVIAGHQAAIAERSERWDDEYRYRRFDGTYAHVIDRAFIEYGEDGEPIKMFGGMVDITDRKETELALKRSEELFRDLYARAPIGIYRTTPEGEILLANDALVEMLGFRSFAELRERNLEDAGFDVETPRSDFRERIDAQSTVEGFEAVWRKKDGTPLVVREHARAVRDEQGEIEYYEGTVEDVTEKRRFESALRHLVEVPVGSDEDDLQRLVSVLSDALEMRWSLFVRPGPDGAFDVVASHGAPPRERIPAGPPFTATADDAGNEILAGFDILCKDAQEFLAWIPAKAMLAVPVRNSVGEPIGTLAAFHDRPIARPSPSDRWLLTAFAQRAGEDLERLEHVKRLEATARAADVLRTAESVEEVYERATNEVLTTTAARSVNVVRFDATRDALVVQYAAGRSASLTKGRVLPRGRGLTWRVLDEGSSVFVPDVSKDADAAFFPGEAQRGAFVAAPLVDPRGHVFGALTADTVSPGSHRNLSRLDLYYVEAIAQAIGVSVARIGALERAREQGERFRLLAELSARLELIDDPVEIARSALEALLPLTGFHVGSMWRVEGKRLRRVLTVGDGGANLQAVFVDRDLAAQGGILEEVLKRREMLWVPDYPEHPLALPSYTGAGLRSLLATPLLLDGDVHGMIALDTFGEPLPASSETRSLLAAVAHRVERALQRAASRRELVVTREEALRALGLALEYRDYETKGHTDRVTALALGLAGALGLDETDRQHLKWGAYLHDTGKVSIPDHILLKPGKLDPAEWRRMQQHVTIGEAMLRELGFLPNAVLDLVRHHHERFDGSGYPDGLVGDAIPLLARVFTVIDVYDALTSERPYKVAWLHEEAMAEIAAQSGKQFDPTVVDAFVAFMEERSPPS